MANINSFGAKTQPVLGDKLHLWSTEDGVDMNITLEVLRALMTGGIESLDTEDKTSVVNAVNELLGRIDDPFNNAVFVEASFTQNAAYRNSAPKRGKCLGDHVTAEQLAAIAARTYEGMWLGDYWIISGRTHTIVSFEPNWNVGDTALQRGHIGVVTDGGWTSAWYSSNDTSRGYVSVAEGTIRKYIKDTVEPLIKADFGSTHVLTYRALYPSAYSSGAATGWAWADACVELLDEVEVYGCQIWGSSPYEVGHSARQLDLFRVDPAFKYTRAHWWLRSVHSATGAAIVGWNGYAYRGNASNVFGVRPLSLIG